MPRILTTVGPTALCLALLGAVPLAGCRGCNRDASRSNTPGRGAAPSTTAGDKAGKLAALPYLNWRPVAEKDRPKRGVTLHREGRAEPGLRLYNSRPRYVAHLIDLKGKVVHTWRSKLGQPEPAEAAWTETWSQVDIVGWHHVEAAPDRALWAIVPYHMLLKLDRDSKVIWSLRLPAHHDLAPRPDGSLYTLTAEPRTVRHDGEKLPIVDNALALVSADGELVRRLSLLDALRKSPRTAALLRKKLDWSLSHYRERYVRYYLLALTSMPPEQTNAITGVYASILDGTYKGSERVKLLLMTLLQPMDILHANTVEYLPTARPGLWEAGDLLLSLRELDLVLVLDPDTGRVRFTWGPGQLDRQHQPSLLPGGNLLVFDNGSGRGHSRLVELDPTQKEVVWTYEADPKSSFFSIIRGGCQRLPGGNLLVTESERGRVFEITRDGELVWEFFNPDVVNVDGKLARAPIYRMTHILR